MNILKFISWTHKHYEVLNVDQDFLAKVAKYQDTLHKSIAHVLTTTQGQETL